MKLSEAIRLGAMLKPQGFGSRFSPHRVPDTSCALDAAALAMGLDLETKRIGDDPIYYQQIADRYPFIDDAGCPMCGSLGTGSARVIWHLNDFHRWTREEIADFVESIEPQQEAATPQPVESGAAPSNRT